MIPHVPYSRRGTAFQPRVIAAGSSASEIDLQSQLEDILDAVWRAEADWRFNDRLDLALKRRR
jgi:hypothetical protein